MPHTFWDSGHHARIVGPRAYDMNQLNLPSGYVQSFNTARSNLINCANAAGTATCGQAVGVLQQILGSVLTTSTATTPLLNSSAAGLANTIDTTYFTQMVAATGTPAYCRRGRFPRPRPYFPYTARPTLLIHSSSSLVIGPRRSASSAASTCCALAGPVRQTSTSGWASTKR